MKVSNLIRELNTVDISSIGNTYVFGSFIKTNGTAYNDIDIYIDANELSIAEIKNKLALLPYDYTVGSKYYAPGPKPSPKPPFPKPSDVVNNNILHVTICKKEEAQSQPFYQTMIAGKHHLLSNENV